VGRLFAQKQHGAALDFRSLDGYLRRLPAIPFLRSISGADFSLVDTPATANAVDALPDSITSKAHTIAAIERGYMRNAIYNVPFGTGSVFRSDRQLRQLDPN
jgi:hypothetical protein